MRFSTLVLFAILGMGVYTVFGSLKAGTSVYPQLSDASLDARPAIIVIHGYYGSALRDAESKRRHFVVSSDLLFGQLAIGLFSDRLKIPPAPRLEPEGLIGRVSVLPFLYEIDGYSGLIDLLRSAKSGHQIIPLVYDWRADPYEAVEKLGALVKTLISDKRVPSVQVVGHSMGGMILTYYLAYGTQKPESAMLSWDGARLVKRAVFLGTPFQGVMTTFRNMEKGAHFPLNRDVLPAESVASFPASYHLLPTGSPSLLDMRGSSINQSLFIPAFWDQKMLGLLKSRLPADVRTVRLKFVEEQLKRAYRFSELIQLGRTSTWPAPQGFQALNVVGVGRKTLDGAYWQNDRFLFDEDEVEDAHLKFDLLQRDGDGTVARASASVPLALESTTELLPSKAPHETLWMDELARGRLNTFLE